MKSNQKGFTLAEVMVVVAIIGIIAAVAVPTYTRQVRETNRKAAQGDMLAIAQNMERTFLINNGAYAAGLAPNFTTPFGNGLINTGACGAPDELTSGSPPRYFFTLTVAPNLQSYALVAAPCANQEADRCGELRLLSSGEHQAKPRGQAAFSSDNACF